jgi:hypothetical protein
MKHLDRLAVERRPQGVRPEDVAEAARLYESGWSLARIGNKFEVAATNVRKRLEDHGVSIRPRRGWPLPAGAGVT